MSNQPHFKSKAIQAAADTAEASLCVHPDKLNAINHDLKECEAWLQKRLLVVEVWIMLPNRDQFGWAKNRAQKHEPWRLMYREVAFDTNKPITECKIQIRIKAHDELAKLITKIGETI